MRWLVFLVATFSHWHCLTLFHYRKTHAMREASSMWTLTFHQTIRSSHPRWSSTPRYGIQTSARRRAPFASTFWKMSGPLHSPSVLPWFRCRHYCAVPNQMIHKTLKWHANIKQIGNCTSSQQSNGCKIMLRRKILKPRCSNWWRWDSPRMSVLRHSNAMTEMSN